MYSENQNKAADASLRIRHLCAMALLCALAYICEFVFRIKVSFLTFDAKDAIIAIGSLAFGPVSGVGMSLVVALLELVTVSETGFYGFIMNFLSSAVFSVIPALLYRRDKSLVTALLGLALGSFGMTAVMMAANLLITPFYMGVSVDAVAKLLPTLLLPFNLTKAVFNAGLTLLLYKPLMSAMTLSHILPKNDKTTPDPRTMIYVTVVSVAAIALSLLIFFLVLNGTIVR